MGLPKIVVRDRKIILLSGFKDEAEGGQAAVLIDAEDKLQQAIEENPDAVAFGYVAGEWVAGAQGRAPIFHS